MSSSFVQAADIGLVTAGVVLGLWAVAVAASFATARTTMRPAVSGVIVASSGMATVLLAGSMTVVDTVADQYSIAQWDLPVLDWFLGHRSGVATALMTAVSAAGGTGAMAVLAAGGVVVLAWRRHWVDAGVVVVAAVAAFVLNAGFKRLYGRARPPLADQLTPQDTFALPSGHALVSVVVIGVLAGICVLRWRSGSRQLLAVTAVVVAAVVVAVIGISRLYLGVHWFTDVVTGWLLGGAWLVVCLGGLWAYERVNQARQAVPATMQ
ncbi:phosphatase PAP2 family protein [Pseudonocardia sp. GCM10023141]|uniref:phosphatase PAP2 family protein n=1 Tax=Pseudonocardia sp. GCM10023141 TaxID=3252653 RepID=UPI00360DC91E